MKSTYQAKLKLSALVIISSCIIGNAFANSIPTNANLSNTQNYKSQSLKSDPNGTLIRGISIFNGFVAVGNPYLAAFIGGIMTAWPTEDQDDQTAKALDEIKQGIDKINLRLDVINQEIAAHREEYKAELANTNYKDFITKVNKINGYANQYSNLLGGLPADKYVFYVNGGPRKAEAFNNLMADTVRSDGLTADIFKLSNQELLDARMRYLNGTQDVREGKNLVEMRHFYNQRMAEYLMKTIEALAITYKLNKTVVMLISTDGSRYQQYVRDYYKDKYAFSLIAGITKDNDYKTNMAKLDAYYNKLYSQIFAAYDGAKLKDIAMDIPVAFVPGSFEISEDQVKANFINTYGLTSYIFTTIPNDTKTLGGNYHDNLTGESTGYKTVLNTVLENYEAKPLIFGGKIYGEYESANRFITGYIPDIGVIKSGEFNQSNGRTYRGPQQFEIKISQICHKTFYNQCQGWHEYSKNGMNEGHIWGSIKLEGNKIAGPFTTARFGNIAVFKDQRLFRIRQGKIDITNPGDCGGTFDCNQAIYPEYNTDYIRKWQKDPSKDLSKNAPSVGVFEFSKNSNKTKKPTYYNFGLVYNNLLENIDEGRKSKGENYNEFFRKLVLYPQVTLVCIAPNCKSDNTGLKFSDDTSLTLDNQGVIHIK